MSPFLIPAGIFLPQLALSAWFHQRLQNALAERHPGALHIIDRMTRSSSRTRQALDRHGRYKMLRDPEIDRHIRNLDRMEILFQYSGLAFFALSIVVLVVSAAHR